MAVATVTVRAVADGSLHKVQVEIPDPALLVGARTKDVTWDQMVATLGPQSVTRIFYQTLPATFDPNDSNVKGLWAPGVVPICSYKSATAATIASFGRSLRPLRGMLVFHHEPEADFPTGKDFTDKFDADYAISKAANPDIPFGNIAGAFEYRANGGTGYDGSFIPKVADFYCIDTYLVGGSAPNTIQPLETEPRFQRWLSLVRPKGKPIGPTEYGRGLTTDPTQDQIRASVIPRDSAYLRELGAFCWIYWWTTGTGTKSWRFTDPPSIAAWKVAH